MPKVTDLMKSTAHAQQAELSALVGAKMMPQVEANSAVDELRDALRTAIAKQDELTSELAAEKESHAKTQAALAAATAAPVTQ